MNISPARFFERADWSNPDGLVLVGGELAPAWLLEGYRRGIFPWPVVDDVGDMAWWSPDPRGIFESDGLHVSRRLQETLRSNKFEVTFDQDFAGVIAGCGTAQTRSRATWLTPEMVAAYTRLFEMGRAHSVEAWHDGKLAGGVYGVSLGGMFSGESMFYRVRDASKVALAALVQRLAERGYRLFDIQMVTDHTRRMGAIEIPRDECLRRLKACVDLPVKFS